MNPDHQEVIAQFCGITGASASAAQSALTAAEWDLEAAISLYYAASDQSSEEPQETTAAPSAPQPSQSQPSASSSSSRAPKNNSKLRTLRDLQSSAADDDDDEERDQDMFAGGEKSGLAVQNPGSGPTDHFKNILNQARQNRDRPPAQQEEEEPTRANHFTGRAQTLGGDDAPSRVIEDPTARRQQPRHERITRTLHLWVDGVSVDDGPLFRFDDEANRHIMEQINRGQAPLSLLDVAPGQEVDLNLEPHKDQEYVQPKKKYKAFSGAGQRLGSPVPGVGTSQPTSQPSVQSAAPTTAAPSSTVAGVQVDESAPVLTLQIRLGDGSRLSSKFNATHTIGDVYDFVDQSNSSQRAYVLVTTFPTQELSDRAQVLGEINGFKKGGVMAQKWL